MDNENDKSLILLIGEIKGKMDLMVNSVNNLAASFENLEKGRLSRAEITIAEMKTEIGNSDRRAQARAMWVGLIAGGVISLLVAIIGPVILHAFGINWG